ncbi:MAG: hypothetical protein KJ731_10840, partial [Alphaproteobacteria bacterium]|nr:hypothetical protein [Alphaproteobacteria bacterium]MBU1828951.1 hypothetical protein [Alphaproteobacteria bacterium]
PADGRRSDAPTARGKFAAKPQGAPSSKAGGKPGGSKDHKKGPAPQNRAPNPSGNSALGAALLDAMKKKS